MGAFIGDIFKWWAISVGIGLIAFPVSFVLFKRSQDKGYMFSKAIGIFLIAYFSWLFGHIIFSTATILLVMLLLAGLSVYLFILNKKEILAFLGEKAALVIITELFYLLIFMVYALFRMYQPDIIGTEKFMDFAFMNSISRADKMPPYDPWMFGKGLHISYYYFGYVIMAIMFKLTAVPSGVGFNLALTYIVAMSALCMVGLLFNLTKNYLIGFLAAAFLLLISNIDGFMQVAANHWSSANLNWWHTSRIIDYTKYDVTINEFPFFSFLLGDMHPHQMAIPFVLLALNIALYFIKEEEKDLVDFKNVEKLSFLAFSGLVLGGLWFLNSWDLPTYFFITVLCIFSNKYSRGEKYETWIKDAGLAAGIIFGVAIVAYLPFTLLFKSQAKGIALVSANTKITDYLTIFGIMLFPIISFIVFRLLNWLYALRMQGVAGVKTKKRELFCPRCGTEFREGKKICGQCGYQISGDELLLGGIELPVKKVNETALSFFKFLLDPVGTKDKKAVAYAGGALGLAVLMFIYKTFMDHGIKDGGMHVFGFFVAVVFLVISVVFLLGMTRVELKENQFVLILIFTGFFAAWGCEIFHIVDTFSTPGAYAPLERMNTVFKFYYQTWIFFSIAAAYGFFWVKHFYLAFKPKPVRWIWYSVFIILIGMGMFYPFAAADVKTGGFRGYFTLDGTDFLKSLSYKGRLSALGDYQAIDWLKKNVKGSPVILEAYGPEYTEFARISSFTGLPTVLGWPGHELQWRGTWDEAGKRQSDVDLMYTTLDVNQALDMMRKYEVKYVYVGALERDKYAANLPGLEKFSQFMDIVYANKIDTVVYKVR